MCVISWCSKWPSDLNAKPQKPFLPQRLNPPELLSVIQRFRLLSMQRGRSGCSQCNLWYLAGTLCPLWWPLCGDEWIFLPNFIQRCRVLSFGSTFEAIQLNYRPRMHRRSHTCHKHTHTVWPYLAVKCCNLCCVFLLMTFVCFKMLFFLHSQKRILAKVK